MGDIIGETRYATPTIGAYKSQVLSSTTLYDGNATSKGLTGNVTSPTGGWNYITLSSFTVPAGDDRLLLVASVQTHSSLNSSASFDGNTMDHVQRVNGVDVFSMVLGSGAAITGDISVSGRFFYTNIGAQSFNNINQTTPIDNITTASGTSVTSMSKTITSDISDLACDFITVVGGSSSFDITADASQTTTFHENDGLARTTGSPYITLASSIKEGASSVDMEWSFPSGKDYDYIGLNLNISNPSALPVNFTLFEVSKNQNAAVLNWQTAMEENNSHFKIERSLSGVEGSWEQIGRVEGQGTTFETTDYQFVDESIESKVLILKSQGPWPSDLEPQTIYYRLKQVDYNGEFEYSSIRTLDLEQETRNSFEVWPNPSNGATIYTSKVDDYTIYSASGVYINSFIQTNKLNVSDLVHGSYLIKSSNGSFVLFLKI